MAYWDKFKGTVQSMPKSEDGTNWIDLMAQYADSHLNLVRLSAVAVGLVGVGVTLRSIRIATQFSGQKQIPKSFIRKKVALRGEAKTVSLDGVIHVKHIPVVSMPWHKRSPGLLPLTVVGVEPTIAGIYTLKLETEGKNIWFKILSRSDGCLHCLLSQEKGRWSNCINTNLVERGLAHVSPYPLEYMKDKTYSALYKGLLEAETKAQKKRKGVWYERNKWDVLRHRLNSFVSKVKQLVTR